MEKREELFTKCVKAKLNNLQLTQKQLALELNYDYVAFNKILNNKRSLNLSLALQLIKRLDINPNIIFTNCSHDYSDVYLSSCIQLLYECSVEDLKIIEQTLIRFTKFNKK